MFRETCTTLTDGRDLSGYGVGAKIMATCAIVWFGPVIAALTGRSNGCGFSRTVGTVTLIRREENDV